MAPSPPAAAPLLLVGLASDVAADVISPLVAAGYTVRLGSPSDVAGTPWGLVICAPSLPGVGAMDLLASLRDNATGLLVVGTHAQLKMAAPVYPSGAQAWQLRQLAWPFESAALVSCVHDMRNASEAAPDAAAPANALAHLSPWDEALFARHVEMEREEQRTGRSPGESFVAALRLDEIDRYRERLDPEVLHGVWRQVAQLAASDALADEQIAVGEAGDLLLLLPGTSRRASAARLNALSAKIASHRFDLLGQFTALSPVLGYASLRGSANAAQPLANARTAAAQSHLHLDLKPVLYSAGGPVTANKPSARTSWTATLWFRGVMARHALIVQYVITMFLGLGVPFLFYWGLGSNGLDISGGVYLFVVVTLVLTALSIWTEGFLALRRADPPGEPASPYPAASAIIAAYLPNEAPIIEDTVRAFLRVQYPAPLQVILAYNTPRDMPEIEDRLQQIAREYPQFLPMRVHASTSKAQNVNAALAYTTGVFTAVFDADHQPDPESFRRAWRWISHGADVVQGHCFIRNGDASWVAKMVAVEFEQIYAVSHPGRARLHGFGIFGGSNGYWRTDLLRELRMHGFMLTEDIDSSMRAVVRGRRIVSDPYLVSRELAPETMATLTKQRLRWAQGWYQVSMKWIVPALRSRNLSVRQKLGMLQLLAWREAYPWVSMQILPLIAWWAVEAGSLARINWWVPLFVVTTLFTLGTGPGQILFTYALADPQIKRHRSWFLFYLVTSTLFYAGLKNAWGRIAHWKEAIGETTWVVTPRAKAKAKK